MTNDAKFLIKIVKKAAKIVTEEFETNAKGENGDLITNFDLAVETFLINRIKSKYPSYSIVSEEYNTLNDVTENCFVIDPIDGTINFAHGLPVWAIMVGKVTGGKTTAGVVYFPKLKELYWADETGAYLNKKKIHVNNLPFKKCLYNNDKLATDKMNPRPDIVLSRNFYCAGFALCSLASGRFGWCWSSQNLWDVVAGNYIVEMAGGVVKYVRNEYGVAANNQANLDIVLKDIAIKDSHK
jgi:myo-inositol-1(or 4)-monophosphatase